MERIVVSGVQPSGEVHLGNYMGAIKQFVRLQNNPEIDQAYFFIADLHALTEPQEPDKLKKQILDLAAVYLACGLDPKKTTLFIQSHVPAHVELSWILGTLTPIGELNRMTQFKEKGEKIITRSEQISVKDGMEVRSGMIHTTDTTQLVGAGLFMYPVLMAADILLYQADFVPVGDDQLQHIELTRTLARKFNSRYGKTFKEPKELPVLGGGRIKGLDDPSKKMSKSAGNKNNYIGFLDSPDEIRRKIKIAVTDSGKEVKYDPDKKPAISNLISIYVLISGAKPEALEHKYKGKSYAELKSDLAEVIINELSPLQKKYHEFSKNESKIIKILTEGAKAANKVASKTMADVRAKIGLI